MATKRVKLHRAMSYHRDRLHEIKPHDGPDPVCDILLVSGHSHGSSPSGREARRSSQAARKPRQSPVLLRFGKQAKGRRPAMAIGTVKDSEAERKLEEERLEAERELLAASARCARARLACSGSGSGDAALLDWRLRALALETMRQGLGLAMCGKDDAAPGPCPDCGGRTRLLRVEKPRVETALGSVSVEMARRAPATATATSPRRGRSCAGCSSAPPRRPAGRPAQARRGCRGVRQGGRVPRRPAPPDALRRVPSRRRADRLGRHRGGLQERGRPAHENAPACAGASPAPIPCDKFLVSDRSDGPSSGGESGVAVLPVVFEPAAEAGAAEPKHPPDPRGPI